MGVRSCVGRSLGALSLVALGCSAQPAAPVDSGAVTGDVADAAVVADAPDGAVAAGCYAPPTGSRAPAFQRLSAPVEVLRDSLGIPHLYAATDDDVFFASGYTQAVDRLFQMELMRRSARGELAAVIGREKLGQDQLVRLMGVVRWGTESAERVRREHPEIHRLLDAWTAGVNRRVAEVNVGTAPLPAGFGTGEFDFRPALWTVDDPYIVSRLILFQNANQLDYDLLATIINGLLPEANALPLARSLTTAFIQPPDERPMPVMARRTGVPRSRPRGPVAPRRRVDPSLMARVDALLAGASPFAHGASNNWAVAGRHTFNGRPLIAGDPHQPIRTPSVMWAQHMNSAARGGTFDVMGFSFAGAPGVHLGHNRRIGWTATTAYPDMMDIWRVPYAGSSVTLAGRELAVRACTETIAVKGEAAQAYPVELVGDQGVLLPTNLTPVPVTSGSERLLYQWTGFRPTQEAVLFFGIDRAASAEAFDALTRENEIAAFNFLAADAQGLAYRSTVLVPDRGDPRTMPNPSTALDGTDPRSVWTGALLSPDRQPHSRGGARGFVASANNDPFGFTANGRYDDDPFYYGTWFDPGTRAGRIEGELTRLTARGMVTVADMEALQTDTYNTLADEVLPSLREAWQAAATTPALMRYRSDPANAALYEALMAWDKRMARDAAAPVIYEGLQHFLARAVLADDVQVLFDAVISREPVYILKLLAHTLNRRFPMADRFMQQGRDALVLQSLDETRAWLAQRFGSADPARYRWRDYHRTVLRPMFDRAGPFDAGSSQTEGSIGTVNVSQGLFFDGAQPRMFHESRAGAVYRMVTSFGADGTPSAVVNFPIGVSGVPGSTHWLDTQDDWVNGRYRPMPYERAAVDADARERSMLMP